MATFKDTHPHITFCKSWSLNERAYFLLGESASIIKALKEMPLLPEFRRHLFTVSLKKGAQATTAIEGNTLSEHDIQKIYDENSNIPESKKYQEVEVKNILNSFKNIFKSLVDDGKIQKITPHLIKDFHAQVTNGLQEYDIEVTPGRYRLSGCSVGNYICPKYEEVPILVDNLCNWLYEEFHYFQDQTFEESIIQAIVTHIYIAWIHPFNDGNGRTARLIEFYLLLRAGVPSIASHILSNFYNDTRSMYYKKIQESTLKRDLTPFINYALQGLKDGLDSTLEIALESQIKTCWEHFVYKAFEKRTNSQQRIIERQRYLILSFPGKLPVESQDLDSLNHRIAMIYSALSKATIKRDIDDLIEMGLLVREGTKYRANVYSLIQEMKPKSLQKI